MKRGVIEGPVRIANLSYPMIIPIWPNEECDEVTYFRLTAWKFCAAVNKAISYGCVPDRFAGDGRWLLPTGAAYECIIHEPSSESMKSIPVIPG